MNFQDVILFPVYITGMIGVAIVCGLIVLFFGTETEQEADACTAITVGQNSV